MRILALMDDTPAFSGGKMAFIAMLKSIEDVVDLTFISTTGATQKATVTLKNEYRFFVPKRGKILYYFIFLIKGLIKGLNTSFDLVFCNAGLAAFIGAVLGKIRRKPFIVLSHDCFTFSLMWRLVKGPIKKLSGMLRVLDHIVPLFFADLILAVSPTTENELKTGYGFSRVKFIGNVIQI